MRFFTGLRDIIAADVDLLVGGAESPERAARLAAQEMEDVLVEMKASCAAAMAARARAQRGMDEARRQAAQWEERALLAVQKRRDQLAREALVEKRRHADLADSFEKEAAESDALVRRCQDDMELVERKLSAVREKQRILLERRISARRQAPSDVVAPAPTPAATPPAIPVPPGGEAVPVAVEAGPPGGEGKPALEQEFERLASDEDIEKELQALKDAAARKAGEGASA